MGVPGIRVEQTADLVGALREAVSRTDGPSLVDVAIEGAVRV